MDMTMRLCSYRMLQREHASLKERMANMELVADEQHTRVGQTNMSRKKCTQLEFDNEDRIRGYLREDVYPHPLINHATG